jgi:parallel beta-helix repeat protein
MSKKFALILSLCVLLSCLLETTFSAVEVKAPDGYPVHNLNTGLNYTTIQEAIDNSTTQNGHVVFVEKGTYYEHVTIFKSISLIGEERDTTIVDANGTGTAILITTDNVSIANFTIRNAGKIWYGTGYPDSCIRGNNVANVHIENNTLTDAAVCAWFYSSSSVNITKNIVFNATTAGIIGYTSSCVRLHSNLVYNCGLMGIHLDDSSINCTIIDNTVMNTLEGIELEKYSNRNRIEQNNLINNNVSLVLNRCGNLNIFRNNNMTCSQYNLIVFGTEIGNFMQDIDSSNTANNKTVYYFTNLHDLIIDPIYYPNLGYLAVVNCTKITLRDFNVTHNGDGLMLAYSTNCTLTNITLSGNREPLMYGGLTFYKSNNNTIVNNEISNNSYAICLYQSDNNTFYHNFFNHNDFQVVADFFSPFGGSTRISVNFWDNRLEGNYWSDYVGLDENRDGIGDSLYPAVASPSVPPELKQFDHYPLMGIFHSFHAFSSYHINVISNSTIEDFSYFRFNSTIRILVSNMTADQAFGFCRVCIPYALMTEPYNVTIDCAEPYYVNYTIYENGSHRWIYFSYQHSKLEIIIMPEFPSIILMQLFMIATLLAVIVYKRKHSM